MEEKIMDGVRKVYSNYVDNKNSVVPPPKLTTKTRAVLYYLIMKSKWNSWKGEDHYFLYKNEVQKKDIAQFLGIARNTVSAAITNLEKYDFIEEQDKVYIIKQKQISVYISQKVLRYLLSIDKKDGADLVHLCAILKDWADNMKGQGVSASDITKMRGKNNKHSEDIIETKKFMAYLRDEGFIDYEIITGKNNFGCYQAYKIKKVFLSDLPENCYFTEQGVAPEEAVERYMNKFNSI